jgi:Chaperone of endosialidase
MAALDFPSSPTVGQKYPATPVSGIPTYTWDGEKWTTSGDSIAALYVAKAGDTMTGDLYLNKADPQIFLKKTSGNQVCSIVAQNGSSTRWQLSIANNNAESGSNAGSDFVIYRYNDAGAFLDQPLAISRTSGNVTLSGTLITPGGIYMGNAAALNMYGGNASLLSDANQTILTQNIGGTYYSYAKANGWQNWVVGGANSMVLQYAPTNLVVYGGAYKPGGGAWLDSSDSRIKNVQGDFTAGLDAVAALRPITYTFKGNDTHEEPSHIAAPDGTKSKEALTVPYPNSLHYREAQEQKVFHGLVAQEVETVLPEIVMKRDGYIDGVAVNDLRDIDTGPLIFALINAIKELKARVEALEAA